MTLRVKIEVPADGGAPHEAEIIQVGQPPIVLAPGDAIDVTIWRGKTFEVREVAAGSKAALSAGQRELSRAINDLAGREAPTTVFKGANVGPSSLMGLKAPELSVVAEKAQLDARLLKLREFTATPAFAALDPTDRSLLQNQALVMDGYSSILCRRIERFNGRAFAEAVVESGAGAPLTALQVGLLSTATYNARLPVGPQVDKAIASARGEVDDFPLGKACDLSGEGTCEACQ